MLAALVICAAASLAQTSGLTSEDHGTFEIFSDGKPIGTETFEIRTHGKNIEAHAKDQLHVDKDGKQIDAQDSSDLLLDPNFSPLSYTWSQNGTQSSQLNVDFRSQPAHVRYKLVDGREDRRDFNLEKDVLLLDDNVVLHYQLAVDRYDRQNKNVQVLRVFIPQEALASMVMINSLGVDADAPMQATKRQLRHLLLTTELARIDLWSDDQGHLQVVSAPSAHFQAVRK